MKKKMRTYGLTIVSSLVILLGTAYVLHLYPFTNQVLFSGDLASQYIPFASFYKEFFHDPTQAIYSLQNGLGSNSLSLISYYLTSPFNLLFLLIPIRDLALGMTVVISLKVVCAAVAMSFYLGKRRQLWNGWNSLLAVSYAFCGFATVYFYNVLWLDVLVWLPLVVYGLELFIDEHRCGWYQWMLFVLLISNYYMAYMVCLFLAMYFIYWIIRHHQSEWRKYIPRFGEFIGRSIVLVLIAGIIYVPTIIGMLNTGKSSFDWHDFIQPFFQFNGWEALAGFGQGASDYNLRLYHIPTFYTGLVCLILALAYLLNRHFSRRQRVVDGAFLLLLILCACITPITMVFQMFQPTAGFPFRFTYLISFVLVLLASESVQCLQTKSIASAGIGLTIFFVLGWFALKNSGNKEIIIENLGITIVWLIVVTLLLVVMSAKIRWLKYGVYGLTLLDLITNFAMVSQGILTVNETNYQSFVTSYQKNLPPQSGIERLDNIAVNAMDWQIDSVGYNDSALLHFNGVNSYTSSLNNTQLDIDHALGLYSWNERRISNIGATPLTDFLLNVTQKIKTVKRQFVTESASGRGGVIALMKPMEALNASDDFKNQNAISQSLFGRNVFTPIVTHPITAKATKVTYQLKAQQAGIIYMQLPLDKISRWDQYHIEVNGSEIDYGAELKSTTLLPIKKVNKGEVVKVTIWTDHVPIKANEIHYAVFDENLFNQSVCTVNTARASVDGLRLTAQLAMKEKGEALVSLPYDKNWRAYVNGKQVTVSQSPTSLMTVPLNKGHNQIKLVYRPLDLYLGVLVTIIGLVIEGLIILFDYKKRKQR